MALCLQIQQPPRPPPVSMLHGGIYLLAAATLWSQRSPRRILTLFTWLSWSNCLKMSRALKWKVMSEVKTNVFKMIFSMCRFLIVIQAGLLKQQPRSSSLSVFVMWRWPSDPRGWFTMLSAGAEILYIPSPPPSTTRIYHSSEVMFARQPDSPNSSDYTTL